MKALKFLWTRHRIALIVSVAALCVAGVFAFNFVAEIVYFNDPAHRQQALEPWMTLRYVSLSWKIPPEFLEEALNVTRDGQRGPLRISDILVASGESLEDLQSKVAVARAAFEELRDARRD